ncbi:MAG: class A beta-lactamase [Acidobacteriota bacterium]
MPNPFPTPEPPPSSSPLPKLDLRSDAELAPNIAAIANLAKGKVGVAAVVLETGECVTLNADQHFPMQSVYKLPIAMAIMEQVRRGDLGLDEEIGVTTDDMVRQGQRSPLRDANPKGGEFSVRELIRLALVESDGTASDVLMRVAGGAPAVQSYLSQIGIWDMKVANTEKEMGKAWETQYQNWATPMAAVELLRHLDSSADHWHPPNLDQDLNESQLLLQFMFQSTPGAARIKGQLPLKAPVSVVAHKTGTSGTQSGITAATNDIGIIYLPNGKRLAIAVFVSDSPADEKTREAVIAKIAKAVWDKFSN